MTKRIKAHPLFATWRADEVAECLNVSEEIYRYLWGVIVPLQPKPRPEREEPTYEYPLKTFWSQVPRAMRRELNQAADEHEAEYKGVVNAD
jgi:hypothetical protein